MRALCPHAVLAEKALHILRMQGIDLGPIHADGHAVRALSHAENRLELHPVLHAVVGDQVLERGNHLMGAAQVAGTADKTLNLNLKTTPFPIGPPPARPGRFFTKNQYPIR